MFSWKKKATNAIYLKEDNGGKGRPFESRFLEAGLVKYSFGVCLLTKEVIDKFIDGFVGCPVIIDHQDITDENVKEKSVGVISDVWYNEKDGWFWCKGIITDKEAIDLINKGYTVSCQYEITEYQENTENKLHNGNEFDKYILNGKPEHLAIVENPRYENAIIAVNAIEVKAENADKWITIKPNGEENKGKHLLLKDGETPQEAIERTYKQKEKSSDEISKPEKKYTWNNKKYSLSKLIEQGFHPIKYNGSIFKDDKLTYLEKDDGKKIYKMPLSDEEYKEALKAKENFKSKKLNQAKKDSKNIIDYVKWQYNKDIEPYITRTYNNKTVIDWKRLPSDIKSALKELNREEKIKLDVFSGWESSIDFSNKKALENLKKYKEQEETNKAQNNIKEQNMFNLGKNKEENVEEIKTMLEALTADVAALKARNEAEDEEKAKKADNEDNKEDDDKKATNEDVDKRKLIDEIGGILKGKIDEELWRTVIGKAEKLANDKSEAGTADNKCKNKCKNEDDEAEYEDFKKDVEEEAQNKKAKNSIEKLFYSGNYKKTPLYTSQKQAIELGKEIF